MDNIANYRFKNQKQLQHPNENFKFLSELASQFLINLITQCKRMHT